VASQLIEVLLRNGWRLCACVRLAETSPGREHRAAGRFRWGELSQADGRHVDVDRLHLATAGVGLVPKAGATPARATHSAPGAAYAGRIPTSSRFGDCCAACIIEGSSAVFRDARCRAARSGAHQRGRVDRHAVADDQRTGGAAPARRRGRRPREHRAGRYEYRRRGRGSRRVAALPAAAGHCGRLPGLGGRCRTTCSDRAAPPTNWPACTG
jgi:hypothetical protein